MNNISKYRTLFLSILLAISFLLKGSEFLPGRLFILDEFLVLLFLIWAIYQNQKVNNYLWWKLLLSSLRFVLYSVLWSILISMALSTEYILPINNILSSLTMSVPRVITDSVINIVMLTPATILISVIIYFILRRSPRAVNTLDEHLIQ